MQVLSKQYVKCVYIQGLDKIIETSGNFKQIYFIMVFDCCPPVKSDFVQLPFTVFEETMFSRWSLSSAVIFGVIFLWTFLMTHIRVWQSLSGSFRFLLEFCFSEEVFLSFSNAVIIFKTVLLVASNKFLLH